MRADPKKVWQVTPKYSYFFATHELVLLNFAACYIPLKTKLTFISVPDRFPVLY